MGFTDEQKKELREIFQEEFIKHIPTMEGPWQVWVKPQINEARRTAFSKMSEKQRLEYEINKESFDASKKIEFKIDGTNLVGVLRGKGKPPEASI